MKLKNLYIYLSVLCISCTIAQNDREILDKSKPLQQVQPITVNFLGHWLGEGKKEVFLKELVNEFEFMNQDVNVNMKYPEDVYFDRRKLNIEYIFNAEMVIKTNPEWDIIRLNNEYIKVGDIIKDQDWGKKYLVDFSEIPEFGENTHPELLSDTIKALYGGIIPGPFIDGYNWILWYNEKLARKIGIEIKQFDMTNDDFVGYLKAVSEYNQRNNTNVIGIYEAGNWKTSHTISKMLFYSEMGDFKEIMDGKFSRRKLEVWYKVLQELERMSQYKPIAANWNETTWTETVNYPMEEKCLFYLNASWMYNIWLKNDSVMSQNMWPAELPVFKPSPIYYGGYQVMWAVLKNAPHRNEAIRLLLSFNKPDVAEKWARYTKSPTGIKGKLASGGFGFDRFDVFQNKIDQKYSGHKIIVTYNSSCCFGNDNSELSNYSEEVLSGVMSAKDAMEQIRKELRSKGIRL